MGARRSAGSLGEHSRREPTRMEPTRMEPTRMEPTRMEHCRIEQVLGEPVLVLAGDLDVRSTGELRAAVHEHLRRCGTDLVSPVILDISAVHSVDATALKVIAAASRQAQRYGVRLVLRGAQPAVRRMLHLTHLIRLIELEREPIPA